MSLLLVRADARHLPFVDGSAQTCVTSPPYWGLRDYGIDGQLGLESTPDAYVLALVAAFREVWRVLRDDGTCWLNLGDSYNNFRSEMGPGQAVHGRDKLNGKPAIKSRRRGFAGLKEKDLVGIPWRVAFALQSDGWYLRSDIVWSKPNPMPERVTDRPTKSHEYVFLLTKARSYYFDAHAVRETVADTENGGLRNCRSVWHINARSCNGAHFATMPEKLVERCVLAGSKSGDVVLDPFMGSGTVARVALKLGRKAIGCDLNPAYLQLADDRTRVTYALPLSHSEAQPPA